MKTFFQSVLKHIDKLDAAGADIEYSYAYALGDGDKAILVFRFRDNVKGEAALAAV